MSKEQFPLTHLIVVKMLISAMTKFKILKILISLTLTIKNYANCLSMIGQSKTVPQNYQLLLDFSGNYENCSVNKCIYHGDVNITVQVTGRTEYFSLQADSKMTIDEHQTRLYIYMNNTLQQIPIVDFSIVYGDVSSIIEIYWDQMNTIVAKSLYLIKLHFSREFDDLRGYYHPIDDVSKSILVIALLIPNRAYRLFPCLSDFKWLSTFELSIIHPSKFTTIAGTPLIYRKELSALMAISVFHPTPKIQPHHLFFAIWSYKKHQTGLINFWYPTEIIDEDMKNFIFYYITSFEFMVNNSGGYPAASSFNVAPFAGSKVIDFYTTRGISLFRESHAIFNNDESTTTDRMELLTDITRSTVRYWIGTLHFPRFWEDYWIYAAMADYIATFLFHVIEPSFKIHDFALARTILWTRCDRDTMAASTIPFYLFDTWEDKRYFRKEEYISYQALTVVATIHQLFEFTDIMDILRSYLWRWGNDQYGPTLKEMLSALNKPDIEKFVNDWLKNRGTPLITIIIDELGEFAEIGQERFNTFGPGSFLNYTWTIPIRCYDSNKNQFYHLWLKSKSMFVNATEIKFCLLSGQSVVPYRVNYPEAWWIDIIQFLKQNPLAITEMHRMWLIDDLYELSVAGYIHIEYLYHLFEYLTQEYDYYPWLAVGKVFGKLKNMLSLSKHHNHKIFHERLLINLISNVYNNLKMVSTQPEDYFIRMHRKNIMNLACSYGHEECLKESKGRLECYLKAVTHESCPDGRCPAMWRHCAPTPDAREIIFCQGLRRATPKFWFKVFQLLNMTSLFGSVRLVISRGLACTENVHILENYLDYMLNDEKMFPGENVFPILLTAARLREDHAQYVLYFITKNHVKLVERIQIAHDYHKHTSQIAEEIYSDDSFGKLSKQIPDDEEVSYLLPENVKKVLTANSKIANKVRPLIEHYIEKKMKKSSK